MSIESQRQNSALASGGISDNIIYSKFIQLIKELNLKGNCLDFGAGVEIIKLLK